MPIIICSTSRSTSNLIGPGGPNPQNRLAQLEAALDSAESEIGQLTVANENLQARIALSQTLIDDGKAREETLHRALDAEKKRISYRDKCMENAWREDIQRHQRGKRRCQIALAITLAAVGLWFGAPKLWAYIVDAPSPVTSVNENRRSDSSHNNRSYRPSAPKTRVAKKE